MSNKKKFKLGRFLAYKIFGKGNFEKFYKKNKVVKEVLDQFLHFLLGFIFSIISFFTLSSATGMPELYAAISGLGISFFICMFRELVLQWPIDRIWDTVIDSLFWILGASLVFLFIL